MSEEKSKIEYAIFRIENKKAWSICVILMRRGHMIRRKFPEILYGKDEALAAARAYRDAMLQAFPPFTNREKARKLLSNNTSGVPGIYPVFYQGKQYGWKAILASHRKKRQRSFAFSRHGGEKEAFDVAVAERERWISEMEGEFVTRDPLSRAIANTNFSNLLDEIDIDASTREGFMARLAAVNTLFDEYYPRYLYVAVRIDNWTSVESRSALVLAITSPGKKTKGFRVSFASRPFGEALSILRDRFSVTLMKELGPDIHAAFMAAHADIFTESRFKQEKSIRARILLTKPRGELFFADHAEEGQATTTR